MFAVNNTFCIQEVSFEILAERPKWIALLLHEVFRNVYLRQMQNDIGRNKRERIANERCINTG